MHGRSGKSNNANIESRDKTKYIKYLSRNRQQIQHLIREINKQTTNQTIKQTLHANFTT
jgi:hypothetical protein